MAKGLDLLRGHVGVKRGNDAKYRIIRSVMRYEHDT